MRLLVRHVTRRARAGAEYQDRWVAGSPVTLGRGTDQDIHLPGERVALAHAVLSEEADGVLRIEAVGSATFRRNGLQARSAILEDGDRVELGGYAIEVGTIEVGDRMLEIAEQPETGARELEAALRARSRPSLESAGLHQRPWALGLAAFVAVAFLLLPLLAASNGAAGRLLRAAPVVPSDHAWLAGPLSRAHAHIGDRCEVCHADAFVPAADAACGACHRDTAGHASDVAAIDAARAFEGSACSDCHREHTGGRAIAADARLCVRCHAEPREHAPRSRLAAVTDFGDDHPQFRATLVRHEDGRRVVTRVPMPAGKPLAEAPNLEFSHRLHLRADGVRGPEGGTVTLVCADCHRVAPGSGRIEPVAFERDCRDCHRLRVPGDVEREVPHGDVEAATRAVSDYFAAWALRGGYPNALAPQAVQRLRRPGQEPEGAERQAALDWARATARLANAEMLGYTTCGKCHVALPDGADGWRLAPVNLPAASLPRARFSHAAHASEGCDTCHGPVARSTASTQSHLPGIDTCRRCHGGEGAPAGRLPSTCIDCHGFHPPAMAHAGRRTAHR